MLKYVSSNLKFLKNYCQKNIKMANILVYFWSTIIKTLWKLLYYKSNNNFFQDQFCTIFNRYIDLLLSSYYYY